MNFIAKTIVALLILFGVFGMAVKYAGSVDKVLKFGAAGSPQIAPYIMTTPTSTWSATTTRFIGSVSPQNNNQYDLGENNYSWRDVYVSGTLYMAALTFSGNIIPGTNNTYNLGSGTYSWKNVFTSSTAFLGGVTSTGDVNPFANNTYDLGEYGVAWKTIYASGTIYGAGISLAGDLLPEANNTRDVGSSVLSWNNIYTSSTAFLGGVTSTGNIDPFANNTYDLGSATQSWKDVYVSGTTYLASIGLTGHMLPTTNNLYDLGSETLSWRNLYASGTVFGSIISSVNSFNTVTWTSATGTNTSSTNLIWQYATGTNTTSTNLFATNFSVTNITNTLNPLANNAYDLGAFGTAWKDVYVSGTIYVTTDVVVGGQSVCLENGTNCPAEADTLASVVARGNYTATGLGFAGASSTGSIQPTVNNSYDLGTSILSWRSLFASSTVHAGGVTSTGNVNPFSNNAYDLGAFALAWKTIYASGTIYGANLDLATGGNVKVASANPKKTLVLTAAGGWPSTTAGAGANVQTEYVTNDVDLLTRPFDPTTVEYVQWSVYMPDNYDGSTLVPLFYWTTADTVTASSTVWGVQCRAYADSDAIDAAWGTAATTSDANNAANDLNITGAASAITCAGTPAGGQMVQFRAFRDATDSGDTATTDSSLMSVKLEYSENAYSH